MPICNVITNIASRRIPAAFETKFSSLIAKLLTKPENKITVMVHPDTRMCRNATSEDAVHVSIWSIAVFSKEKNPQYSAPLYSFINETLGVPVQRITIAFHDLLPEEVPPPPQ